MYADGLGFRLQAGSDIKLSVSLSEPELLCLLFNLPGINCRFVFCSSVLVGCVKHRIPKRLIAVDSSSLNLFGFICGSSLFELIHRWVRKP